MEEIQIPFVKGNSSELHAALLPDFEIELIHGKPATDKSIIVTIMAEGYTKSEQDKFIKDAKVCLNDFWLIYPFSYFKDQFSVYAIKVISNESGIGKSETELVDSYFGIYKIGTKDISYLHRLDPYGVSYNDKADLIRDYFYRTTGFDFHKEKLSMILANDASARGVTNFGGYAISTVGFGGKLHEGEMGPFTGDMATHELAHSFGYLNDERKTNNMGEAANMTRENDPAKVTWKFLLGAPSNVPIYGGIGGGLISVYNIAGTEWHIPHSQCKMAYTDYPFCAVCCAQMFKQFAGLTGEPFYGYSKDSPKALTGTIIPSGTTRILPYAFWGREELTSLVIPNGITEIGASAFISCTNLTDLTIPDSVTNLEIKSFKFCPNLRINGHIGSNAAVFANKNQIPFKLSEARITDIKLLHKLALDKPVTEETAGTDVNGDGAVNVFDITAAKMMMNKEK